MCLNPEPWDKVTFNAQTNIAEKKLSPKPQHATLVGGFKHFFHNIWDNPSHWLSYFSRWLKPPTSTGCWFQMCFSPNWSQPTSNLLPWAMRWFWSDGATSGCVPRQIPGNGTLGLRRRGWGKARPHGDVPKKLGPQNCTKICAIFCCWNIHHLVQWCSQLSFHVHLANLATLAAPARRCGQCGGANPLRSPGKKNYRPPWLVLAFRLQSPFR